ncbi:P-loop containing nucleoside triphosphate hydrolase protein [Microdochium bolleyi]|uniref:p-loop containing nucleoside triphosphate hydrolase protein n=1 Tax=Microdochium bolleyi TaxID=196109 RepID=A0A136J2N6_9PEZI|nr:P-loop containing nucleoside triphosphate hydrolase protein [Microdochium bolleyi]
MPAHGTIVLATSAAGLGAVGLLSIPAGLNFFKQIRNREIHDPDAVYEDADGKSTLEATRAFTAKWAKASILLFAAAGLLVSVAVPMLTLLNERAVDDGFFLENWLCVGSWSLLMFQAVAIASAHSSVVAHDLGLQSMLACVVLLLVRLIQDNQLGSYLFKHDLAAFVVRLGEIVVVVALGISCLQLPRRPDVFDGDQVVDRAMTESAWSRYNWSWAFNVLQAAKEKNNLDMKDLPRPDHYVKASSATARWEMHNFTGPLWLSIVKAHKGTLALQWFLTLCTSVLNFAPQWCVLQLLRILENRESSEPLGYDAWLWVIWIGVTIVAQSWVESHVFWLSYGQLCVRVRAELSALVFKKSMRRKDVKEAKKKNKPTASAPELTIAGAAGNSTAVDAPDVSPPQDDEEEEDPDQLKKSKQGTVNLIGVDAKRVADFCAFANYFPGSLFKLIVSLAFLLDLLGWKALVAGFSTMLTVMPVNIYFSKRYSDAQDRLMKVRDEKLEVVSEALQGIRQIKFAALEQQWEEKIGEVRERELASIWYAFINDCALLACWISSPIMLAAASLAVYAYVHGSLLPSVAFVSLGVFKALEVTLSIIPELTTDALDAWVSVKRIDAYLNSAEVTKISKDSDEISFDDASIAWPSDNTEEDPDRFILRNMNITFPKGELSVVSGKTGSGKSLLLASILGEVDVLSGSLSVPRPPAIADRHDHKANKDNWYIPGSIAFVAQIPWIENATVKDNILFGLPLDEERYKTTVEVCALTKDIEMFSDGDRTEIGANGINLSGGQKWRITLARAIYSRAGILVLDDIFSAVDAHVGRHIFEKCLTGVLGDGRTRILVTHHVALCESRTKYLVELGDGVVLNAGFIDELQEDGTLTKIKSHEPSRQDIQEEDDQTAVNSEEVSVDDNHGEPLAKTPSKLPDARKFVEEETRERGSIKKKVYATYLSDSGGWPFWTGAAFLFFLVMALGIGRSWWLKLWTDNEEQQTDSLSLQANDSNIFSYASQMMLQEPSFHLVKKLSAGGAEEDLRYYLGIYVALAVITSAVSTFRWYYIFRGSIVASRTLFAKISFVVLRAPLRWLDTVPVGRVLNRFTADFNSVDTHLAYALGFGFGAVLNLLGVIIAGIFVSPIIIVLSFVLLAICLWYALFYLHGARPVKRLESTAKSPVFEQFTSALTGVTTIRGFDKSDVYIQRMFRKIDDWSTSSWHLWLFNRWMGWRMSVVGSFFASFVAILILLTPNMKPALAGFALSFALDFAGSVMWSIRHYATIELEMNAAERIVEYTELPTESLEGNDAPATWPTEGRVELNDLVVSYADDLPPVLKGLTFAVNSNERVGVVGRTGAGKSSLTLALFRFLEAKSGSIYVDGLDISKIKLHDLRSRLAIIPQDPVLFSGTVRSNLDPFDNHTDAELYDCLARVHLISDSETLPSSGTETPLPSGAATPTAAAKKNTNIFRKLSSPISEGGLNLSQGQRQLLCLARAIVSRPKVMVLDEATSAVDMKTDALIQRSIREEFGGSTLLVIAHRLSTIADFDRILVLSDGKVAEYGSPKELWDLKPEDGSGSEFGIFRGMCEESGEKDKLRKICLGQKE